VLRSANSKAAQRRPPRRGDRTLDTEDIPGMLVPDPMDERDDKPGMDESDEKPGMEDIWSMPGSEPTTGMASRVLSRFMNPPMGIAGKPEARPPMELMPGISPNEGRALRPGIEEDLLEPPSMSRPGMEPAKGMDPERLKMLIDPRDTLSVRPERTGTLASSWPTVEVRV